MSDAINNDLERFKILLEEYNMRDKLVVQEFSIGIAAIALLFNILIDNNINLLFAILLFIFGILAIFTLITSLTKLGNTKYVTQNRMRKLALRIGLDYIEAIKNKNKKKFFGRRNVTDWIRWTMLCLLIVWIIIGLTVIYNLI